jgi:hypothetical protein
MRLFLLSVGGAWLPEMLQRCFILGYGRAMTGLFHTAACLKHVILEDFGITRKLISLGCDLVANYTPPKKIYAYVLDCLRQRLYEGTRNPEP